MNIDPDTRGRMPSLQVAAKELGWRPNALISATENAARSAARHGVRINCIATGTIRTELTESRGDFSGERYKNTVAQYPIGRLGTTEDIVNAFLFLTSDASSFICGHTLVSDGLSGIKTLIQKIRPLRTGQKGT